MTELPPIDGKSKYLKRKGKSHDRHERENDMKIARQVGMSLTQLRRAIFIKKYGDAELIELWKNNEISTWRAYKITYLKQLNKLFDILEKKR